MEVTDPTDIQNNSLNGHHDDVDNDSVDGRDEYSAR